MSKEEQLRMVSTLGFEKPSAHMISSAYHKQAHYLFVQRKFNKCRQLIPETLQLAAVPLACRCELLQQLACVQP